MIKNGMGLMPFMAPLNPSIKLNPAASYFLEE
jgi:hypothetical protein